jgi:4-hydroxythreonine-4-phosphate dehydrogenase
MGDPAGVGPEIIARVYEDPSISQSAQLVVVGDASVMQEALKILGSSRQIYRIEVFTDETYDRTKLNIVDLDNLPWSTFKTGQIDSRAGKASYDYINTAIDMALDRLVDGVVTGPIHKQSMQLAGYNYPGHTEILTERSGTKDYAMLFVAGSLNVILVTTHCSMRDALDMINVEAVLKKIQLADQAMKAMGVVKPRIAVAGINPHAGEGGRFGIEEKEILEPAITLGRAAGLEVTGPYPPDTVFYRARRGEFDIVVSMFHDQGLIPVKLDGFAEGVNVTYGLPFVRTSPDHGTAFDIAWQGLADPRSMISAIKLAIRLTRVAHSEDLL